MPPIVVATIRHDAVRDMTQLCRNFAKSEISISDKNPRLLPSFVQTAVNNQNIFVGNKLLCALTTSLSGVRDIGIVE
jgi:hypothetical protein